MNSPFRSDAARSAWSTGVVDPYGIDGREFARILASSVGGHPERVFIGIDAGGKGFRIDVVGVDMKPGHATWGHGNLWLDGEAFDAVDMLVTDRGRADPGGPHPIEALLDLAERTGVRKVGVEARGADRFAWIRFGFLPEWGAWKRTMKPHMRDRLARARRHLPDDVLRYCDRALDPDAERTVREVAAWTFPVPSLRMSLDGRDMRPLGETLLVDVPERPFYVLDPGSSEAAAIRKGFLAAIALRRPGPTSGSRRGRDFLDALPRAGDDAAFMAAADEVVRASGLVRPPGLVEPDPVRRRMLAAADRAEASLPATDALPQDAGKG